MRPKTYSYLTNHNDENKKTKGAQKCVKNESVNLKIEKRKRKFEDYKHCLGATQHQNKTNQLEKYKLGLNSLRKKKCKEFINNDKLILNSQHRSRSKKHNVYTEEVNKIVLSYKDEKRTHLSVQ